MYGLNRNTGPDLILVKTALDKLVADERLDEATVGKATALDPLVFTQESASNAAVVASALGGGGYYLKSTDDYAPLNSAAKKASSTKTIQIAQFSQNLPIARTFMADQQQSAVAKSVRQATQAWMASRDRNASSVYANGFTTETTVDGLPIFSNVHVNENGDTVDNLETGALATDTLNASINSLRRQINQGGVIVGYEPKFLFVPSLLHMTAMATAKSVLRAGTGNNDLNYFSELYPGMKVVYSPFLDSTSTTAYFIGTSNHSLTRYERESFFTSLVNWETSPDDEYVYKMRAREEVSAIDYAGLVGSTGV